MTAPDPYARETLHMLETLAVSADAIVVRLDRIANALEDLADSRWAISPGVRGSQRVRREPRAEQP